MNTDLPSGAEVAMMVPSGVERIDLGLDRHILLNPAGSTVPGTTVISASTDKTGLFLWRGAREFIALWCADQSGPKRDDSNNLLIEEWLFGSLRNTCIVELGAGVGVGALVCAAFSCDAFIEQSHPSGAAAVITDFWEPVLALAEQHVALNGRSAAGSAGSWVAVRKLDWTWALEPSLQHHLDEFCCHLRVILKLKDGACRRLQLLGLDVVYPDTRSEVLKGLMMTTAALLTRVPQELLGEEQREGAGGEYLLMSFVERDLGLSIRRMLDAADCAGLAVIPLLSPFCPCDRESAVACCTAMVDPLLGRELQRLAGPSCCCCAADKGILPQLLSRGLAAAVQEAAVMTAMTSRVRELLLDGRGGGETLLRVCASHGRWILALALPHQRGLVKNPTNLEVWAAALPWLLDASQRTRAKDGSSEDNVQQDKEMVSDVTARTSAVIRRSYWSREANRVLVRPADAAPGTDCSGEHCEPFGSMEL
jgi:hypothetical protein